jgi:hypothetical protein
LKLISTFTILLFSWYQRYYCASSNNNHEGEEFAFEDEDKELVSNSDDEVLSEDEIDPLNLYIKHHHSNKLKMIVVLHR